MNEELLASALDEPVPGEPPLGFDPDDVVTRAGARRQRRRATVLAAGGAAVVLAGAATAVSLAGSHARQGDDPRIQSATGASATAPPSGGAMMFWPPADANPPSPNTQQVAKQWVNTVAQLDKIMPQLQPDTTSVQAFPMPAIVPDPGNANPSPYSVSLGPGWVPAVGVTDMVHVLTPQATYSVLVTLGAVAQGSRGQWLAGVCDQFTSYNKGFGGTCAEHPSPGGGVLITAESRQLTGSAELDHQIMAADYRPNGTAVVVTSVRLDKMHPGTVYSMMPVTILSEIALDPSLTLH